MPEATVVWDAQALLGEGPIWDERERVLHWVDVDGSTLHTLEPATGEKTSRKLAGRCSSVALCESGGLLIAHDRSVSRLEGDVLVPFAPEISPKGRTNDGAVDPRGHYLVGTVAPDGEPRTGVLYRVDPDATYTELLHGIGISNGIDWSLDGQTMYYVDSHAHSLDAFDYDLDTATLANRRTIAPIEEELGDPDGLTVDAEGTIWLAVWGGSRVRRYSPAGELLEELQVPAKQASSCIFGGDDLATLYVTSARTGLEDAGPHDGGLFSFGDLGVKGRPAFRFAL
jgi:sugar lactone lactonase YvrE